MNNNDREPIDLRDQGKESDKIERDWEKSDDPLSHKYDNDGNNLNEREEYYHKKKEPTSKWKYAFFALLGLMVIGLTVPIIGFATFKNKISDKIETVIVRDKESSAVEEAEGVIMTYEESTRDNGKEASYSAAEHVGLNDLYLSETIPAANVNKIKIDTELSDINIFASNDDNISIDWFASDSYPLVDYFNVYEKNGELKIEEDPDNHKLDLLDSLNPNTAYVNIYMPADKISDLKIESEVGDIIIENDVIAEREISIESEVGDIVANGSLEASRIEIDSEVGEVILKGSITANDLDISTEIGDVVANNINGKKVEISSSVGDIKVSQIDCSNLEISTSVGELKVDKIINAKVKVKTAMGTKEYDNIDSIDTEFLDLDF